MSVGVDCILIQLIIYGCLKLNIPIFSVPVSFKVLFFPKVLGIFFIVMLILSKNVKMVFTLYSFWCIGIEKSQIVPLVSPYRSVPLSASNLITTMQIFIKFYSREFCYNLSTHSSFGKDCTITDTLHEDLLVFLCAFQL